MGKILKTKATSSVKTQPSLKAIAQPQLKNVKVVPKEQSKKAVAKVDQSKKIDKKAQKKVSKNQQQLEKIQRPIFTNYSTYLIEKTKVLNLMRSQALKSIKFDKQQVQKAVHCLIKHHLSKVNVNNLLDTSQEDFIYIEVTLKKIPETFSIRPIAISLPHPIYGKAYHSQFCVFVKDPQREFKDQISDMDIPCIAKVQGYSKLIKKFPTFQDKRVLCNDYDLFLCDYKIYDLLGKHTGKAFYSRKKFFFKQEFHIQLIYPKQEKTQKKHQMIVQKIHILYLETDQSSKLILQSTLKIARLNQKQDFIVENILEGFYSLISNILCDQVTFQDVESVSIKTFNSISLPIYNFLNLKEIQSLSN